MRLYKYVYMHIHISWMIRSGRNLFEIMTLNKVIYYSMNNVFRLRLCSLFFKIFEKIID